MKNFEKYKTAEERTKGFNTFCDKRYCSTCEIYQKDISCRFAWLDVEMEEELLSCPFCGGEAIMIKSSNNNDFASITCRKCSVYTDTIPIKKAIEQWNRRVNND